MKKNFFLIKVVDNSREYCPESKTILDIPTAYRFFSDPDSTKRIVLESARNIVEKWNELYYEKNGEVFLESNSIQMIISQKPIHNF